MTWNNWIVIIGFVILFGWCMVKSNQYDTLKVEYESLKTNKESIIDSLNNENAKAKYVIQTLEDSLKIVDNKVVHHYIKVDEVKKEQFVVSTTLSESTRLLKKNLLCTNL